MGTSILAAATPPARTPEQVLENLVQAAQKGDVEEVLSCMTADSRQAVTESFVRQAALRKAGESFRAALEARFGKGAEMLTAPPDDLATAVGRLAAAEIVAKTARPDGSVELQVKTSIRQDGQMVTREERVHVVRERGSWKLSLGFAPDRNRAAQQETAAEQIRQRIQQGEYKDPLSAMVALDQAWAPQKGSGK
jgi:hypothetical protein